MTWIDLDHVEECLGVSPKGGANLRTLLFLRGVNQEQLPVGVKWREDCCSDPLA
jgi:hypothetical protein